MERDVNTREEVTWNQRLKSLRLESGLQATQVAKRAGITTDNLYKYERGQTTNPRGETIEALAAVYNVSPAYLRWGDEKVQPPRPVAQSEASADPLLDEAWELAYELEKQIFKGETASMKWIAYTVGKFYDELKARTKT